MKWLVGIDPRPGSQGALAFAHWLCEAARGEHEFVPVHVLGRRRLASLLTGPPGPEVLDSATAACGETLERMGATALGEPLLVVAEGVEEGLRDLMREHDAEGIIVSRQGGRPAPFVRLGSVTRRLLLALPGVVAVVPPALRREDMPAGPIISLCSLRDDSVRAARVAVSLAAGLGRACRIVHAHASEDEWGEHYLPPAIRNRVLADQARDTGRRLHTWLTTHGLEAVEHEVERGNPVEVGIAVAERAQAAALVVGSRGVEGMDRLLLATVGPAVAAHADRPVMVVPVPPTG